jgi:CDP-glycerol glycerophosphotransferase (TagB/SpsB family)
MNDFVVSDLLISDRTSSIVYEYLITGKPIIVIDNDFQEKHAMPQHLQIDDIAEHWDKNSNISKLIEHSFTIHKDKTTDYRSLLNRCFYFNDGKSTQRAIDFIIKIMQDST